MADPATIPETTVSRDATLVRRLRIAGGLIAGGLLVELFTLYWWSPASFLVFAGVGGALAGLGVLAYLLTIVSR